MDLELIGALLGTWGYAAFLLLLVLTGVGSPIPEDLVLVMAGYLVFTEVFEWSLALPVGVAGVVGSDVILYGAGRHVAWRSRRASATRLVSIGRLQRATRWFARLGHAVVFVARLVPGTRAIVFFAAGVRGMPFGPFVAYDLLGAALWVPAMLSIGHRFGKGIGGSEHLLSWLTHGAFWITALVVVLLALWSRFGRDESTL